MPAKKANSTNKSVNATSKNAATSSNAAVKKTNTISIFAIILTFLLFTIPIVGLILGIVALVQIKKRNEGGKGLAIASIVISSILIVLQIAFVGFMLWLASVGNGISSGRQKFTFNVNGNSVALGGLPNGFPADVVIYPGSKVFVAGKSNDNQYAATLSTSDTVAKIKSYYKTQMLANGWAEVQSQSADQAESNQPMGMMDNQQEKLTFTKDTREVNIEIIKNAKNSSIIISVGPSNQNSTQNETN